MALKVGQDKHGIIVEQVAADRDLGDPLGALDGEHGCPLLVHDIDRAEGPAVVFDGLAVLFSAVAVTGIKGIGVHDHRVPELGLGLNQVFDPGPGDDIGAVLLTGVELDGYLSVDIAVDLVVDLLQALGRQVTGEINDRFISRPLLIGNILLSARPRDGIGGHFYVRHVLPPVLL